MPETQITIRSDGPRVVETNYWRTTYALHGRLFLSINGGALRLLLPPAHYAAVKDMQGAKTVVATRGVYKGRKNGVELLFDDGFRHPYAIHLDPRQCDRTWAPEDNGARPDLLIYTEGPTLAWETKCWLRHALDRHGEDTLPFLKPWGEI